MKENLLVDEGLWYSLSDNIRVLILQFMSLSGSMHKMAIFLCGICLQGHALRPQAATDISHITTVRKLLTDV